MASEVHPSQGGVREKLGRGEGRKKVLKSNRKAERREERTGEGREG